MSLVSLSYHFWHIAAIVFVVAIFTFLVAAVVRDWLDRRRAARNPRPGFLYDRNDERLPR
jgi:predicted small integral membrane protein